MDSRRRRTRVRVGVSVALALLVGSCSGSGGGGAGGGGGGGPAASEFALASAAFAVAEDAGPVAIAVRRIGSTIGAVSVDYGTADGTATAGADYVAISGTLTWAEGDGTDKTITVEITDDALDEGNQTVNLALNNPTGGATLGTPRTAVVTIVDDDCPPQWTSSGDDQGYAAFGRSVASAGDVDGDGYDDVVVGASIFDTSNPMAGKAYVYHGGSAGLSPTPSWESSGDGQLAAYFGESVGSAGDVNGDGYDDVIVGAPQFNAANLFAGGTYLYHGGPAGLSVTPAWESSGDDQAYAYFGYSPASAGDVNGDGYDDVAVGAFRFDATFPEVGKAYLFRGGPAGVSLTPSWASSGDDEPFANFGISVAFAGDVNGDARDDFIVGAPGSDTANPGAGKAYVYTDCP